MEIASDTGEVLSSVSDDRTVECETELGDTQPTKRHSDGNEFSTSTSHPPFLFVPTDMHYMEVHRNELATYHHQTDSQQSSSYEYDHALAVPNEPYTPIRLRPPRTESIFSSEIYLVDNTAATAGSGWGSAPPLFAQDVRIDGWAIVGDGANPRRESICVAVNSDLVSNTRHTTTEPQSSSCSRKAMLGASQVGSLKKVGVGSGAYVVYDIIITTREGTTMKILKRYSAFEELWEGLMSSIASPLHPQIPNLPPKAPLARFRPAFLEKRRKLLEFWLTRVLLHPELGGRKVVREWVLM